jgi:hypothetical protein
MAIPNGPKQIVEKVRRDTLQLNSHELELLQGLEGVDRDRMIAQLKLQKYQELVSFISNESKKDTGTSTIFNNLK